VSSDSEIKTWFWIPKTWLVLYTVIIPSRVLLGAAIAPVFFWWALLLGVPIIVIPITYRSLVNEGCSLQFHICPLVKGILAGIMMFVMTVVADWTLNLLLAQNALWPVLYASAPIRDPNQIWWFSGAGGGLLARIAEVRDLRRQQASISVVGTT